MTLLLRRETIVFPSHPLPPQPFFHVPRKELKDLLIGADLFHTCWKGAIKLSVGDTKERFTLPSFASYVRNWKPIGLFKPEDQCFSDILYASDVMSRRKAQHLTELLKTHGVSARVLHLSKKTHKIGSFERAFKNDQSRVLVEPPEKETLDRILAPPAKPLSEETLDKATQYLRTTKALPGGHFITLGGQYYWGDAESPFVPLHPGVINNLSEKNDPEKLGRYVSLTQPVGSICVVDIAASYVKVGKEFLMIERAPHIKNQPSRAGIPGGKRNDGETDEQAALRELEEETGINLPRDYPDVKVEGLEPVYVTINDQMHFKYTAFVVSLPSKPKVTLNPEELIGYGWMTLEKALKHLALIDGEDKCFEIELERQRQLASRKV